jgi:CheY-like chemotaxis protein
VPSKSLSCLIISGSDHVSGAVNLFLDRESQITSEMYIFGPARPFLPETGRNYDCVILDISMIDANKPEAVQMLKTSGLARKIISLDTSYDEHQAGMVKEAGADECLVLQDVGEQLVPEIFRLCKES